jgi:plasmid stabilization system protein ParE
MSRPLIIRPEAEAELAEAFEWYEQQREGLGKDFLLSIEASLAEIRRRPRSFPVVHRDTRRALIRRFPYGIFFLDEETRITVLAIFHAKRNPKRWRKRSR